MKLKIETFNVCPKYRELGRNENKYGYDTCLAIGVVDENDLHYSEDKLEHINIFPMRMLSFPTKMKAFIIGYP